MHILTKEESTKHQNSPDCIAYEYPIDNKDINGAIIELTGRYPEKNSGVNTVCQELVYVIEGAGSLKIEGQTTELKTGDMVLINPHEKYVWHGNMKLFIACTPAWYPEQHKEVAEK